MDIQTAIRYAIWYRLTQDETMRQLFDGPVPLHLVWAPKDAPPPYMVHRFENSRADTIIKNGRWYLDFWDYHDTAGRIYAIVGRAIELMELSVLGLVNGGSGYVWTCQVIQEAQEDLLVAARFFLDYDGDVPEDTQGIWHYATVWNVRFTLSPSQIERLINTR